MFYYSGRIARSVFKVNGFLLGLALGVILSLFTPNRIAGAAVEIPTEEVTAEMPVKEAVVKSTPVAEKTSAADKIIGSTFKTLAKGFVSTVDIKKLKNDNIAKLNKKDEAKFRKQYVKVYKVIKDCPIIVKKYGIREDLTKKEAIAKLEGIEKKDMYFAINSVPDSVIVNQFRQYLEAKKMEVEKSNTVEQIKKFWEKMTAKALQKPENK